MNTITTATVKTAKTPVKPAATRHEPDTIRETPGAPMKKVKYVSHGVEPGTGRKLSFA
jgi:hypothetical protein